MMSELEHNVANLSPAEKRALLAQLLAKKARESKTAPASFSQERMWLLQQMNPASAMLNLSLTLRLRGQLDRGALERALHEMVRRHETLRTAFTAVEGQPAQLILPQIDLPLRVIDLRETAEAERHPACQSLLTEATLQPFDLTQAPLLRILLVQTAATDFTLHLVLHHTICDGWSMTLVARELSVLYGAFVSGQPAPLPDLPIQYSDFSRWQREQLAGSLLQDQVAYWHQQLRGSPPVLELPIDHPRPAVLSLHGERLTSAVSADLLKSLKSLSQHEGATLFMTLLAAFKVLLWRLSGQDDIVIGSPVMGRARAEVEDLIGVFINNLVLRTDVSGNPTFRELLQRVRTTALEAYAHQDVPFEKIVEDLQPERSLSHTPLFQVMFNLLSFGLAQVELPGLQVESTLAPETGTNFDLTLYAAEHESKLELLWEYNSDLFDAATVARFSGYYAQLLESIVAQPGAAIAELPMLTTAERQQVLVEWNNTAADYPRSKGVAQLFEEQAARTPEAVAVIAPALRQRREEALSYAELNRRANHLAHYLVQLGVGPGVYVGISLERSIEMLVALLGVLKAGGAYVPLDPAFPRERLAFMLEDAQVPVLLTQRSLTTELPAHAARPVCLDTEWDAIAQESIENLTSRATPDDLAYILYTSGSTGKPKGVEIPQRALTNFLMSMQQQPGLSATDVLLAVTTLSFDIAGLELYLPLITGARVVVVSREVAADGAQLLKALDLYRATVMQATPATWRMLIDSGWTSSPQLKMLCGGEALPRDLADQLLARGGTLWNLYGPTETTIWSSTYEVLRGSEPIHLGFPIANTQFYILNASLQPAPIGVAGELFIGGDGVARGYVHRPELTAERFLDNPFLPASQTAGAAAPRMYRTGDLARYRANGTIEFLGRADFQVKVRGFRIELGDIEAALLQHAQVHQAVVVAREDQPGDKRLVGYVIPEGESALTPAELRAFLKERLPDYMIPTAFVTLAQFPLTPNGKVDRRALPTPGVTAGEVREYVAPRTLLEEDIAAIWAEVLRIERVGMHDNFFELGGHSLLATKVVARLREKLSIDPPLSALFEVPTVAELAEKIATTKQAAQPVTALPLVPVPHDQPVTLSFSQERMWLLQQLNPTSTTLNLPLTLRLRGQLDQVALERSLTEVMQRHETLRTSFVAADEGRPLQIIAPRLDVPLKIVDLRATAEAHRSAALEALLTQTMLRPFDLTQAPLWRAVLTRTSDTDFTLQLVLHHIICDGWSLTVLAREVSALYAAFVAGQPSPLPALPIQYADFCAWQRAQLSGEILQEQQAYWRKQLQGSPPLLDLPLDHPRPAMQTFRGAQVSTILPDDLLTALKTLSQQEDVTLFMTLLSAFQILLARLSGQDDIPVGSPIMGRTRAEVEGLIGVFINNLVLRTDLAGHPTFRDVLRRMRAVALDAYAHQEIPFEKIVEDLQPERSLSHSPLFQVMFNMMSFGVDRVELPDLQVEFGITPELGANFDMTLYSIDRLGHVEFVLVYNVDLFDQPRMVGLLDQYLALLMQLVEQPDRPIGSYSLVTPVAQSVLPDPRQPLRNDWLGSIPARLGEQAQRLPEQTALVDQNGVWSYRELDELSNRLAHYLHGRGVQAEDRVAIYAQRSAPLVLALTGILKAGAAFVVLDPAYPATQLIDRLRMSRPAALLQIEAAGTLAPALEDYLSRASGGVRLMLPDTLQETCDLLKDYPAEALHVSIEPDQLAYVAFTSGSTGLPKGILGNHRALSQFLEWHSRTFEFTASERFSLLSGLAHDPLLRDVFTPLWVGARLCIPSQVEIETLGLLAAWFQRQQVTVTHLTPAMSDVLVEAGSDRPMLTDLRYAFFVGDMLTWQHVWRLRELAPVVTCVNFYGATETPQAMAYNVLDIPNLPAAEAATQVESLRWPTATPVGRGRTDVQLLLLNAAQQLTGVGELGEIYIRSPYLARGYLDDEAQTQERFVVNPFTQQPNDRMFRTGDLGRYLPDGKVAFVGRRDQQVKIRGFRVELGEIEAVLRQHPAIADIAVVAHDTADRSSRKQIAAYLVTRSTATWNVRELREFLAERLPAYAIPAAFVELPAIPLTPNGKVDRRALPKPDMLPSDARSYVAPRTPLEATIAAIWAQVLNVEQVGVHDNFFELGGHSLLAIKLFAQIEKAFGKRPPLTTLFNAPTVEQLAKVLQSEGWSTKSATLIAIQPNGSKPPFFCVHGFGGGVLDYGELARLLGSDQPFYGLQARGIDGVTPIHTRIEDMASDYIEALRTVQPHGPYYLGGYCYGGVVAFEMARQLLGRGEAVGLIGVFDGYAPVRRTPRTIVGRFRALISFLRNLPYWLRDYMQLGREQFVARMGTRLRTLARAIFRRPGRPMDVRLEDVLPNVDQIPLMHQNLMQVHLRATRQYHPGPYPGIVTLFRVRAMSLFRAADPEMGWGTLAQHGVEVRMIGGGHNTILEHPGVDSLAEHLSASLEVARRKYDPNAPQNEAR
jgi:amino acid adenylation domain-containing protein